MSTRGLYYRACAGEQNRRGLAPRCGRRGYQLSPPRTWGNQAGRDATAPCCALFPAHVGQPIDDACDGGAGFASYSGHVVKNGAIPTAADPWTLPRPFLAKPVGNRCAMGT